MNMLEVQKLSVQYGDLQVVKSIDFSVQEGQWLMIVGPNGAGKSTILNAISGGVPYQGKICLKDMDIRTMKPVQLARQIGILAQNHSIGYDFSVREIVNLGRYAYSKSMLKGSQDGDEEAVEEALKVTGLTALSHQSVLNLSGGEVQRTFLAQLFAQNPELMILDEPVNHLDLIYQKQIFDLITKWLETPGRAVISVVHDLSLAKAYGSHCLLIHKGQNIAFGSIRDVLNPERLNGVYGMDVYAWMRQMFTQWQE